MRVKEATGIIGRGIVFYVEDCDAQPGDLVCHDGYVWEVRGVGYSVGDDGTKTVTELVVRKARYHG